MRILLFRPDRLGDVIISSAAISAIEQARPGTEVYFSAAGVFGPLIFPPASEGRFVPCESLTGEGLRSLKLDLSIHLHPNQDAAQVAAESAIPQRIGFEQDAPWMTQALPYRKDEGTQHELSYCLDLVRTALPEVGTTATPHLAITPRENNASGSQVVIHPGSFGAKAKLPPALLAALAEEAVDDASEVLLIGTAEERSLAENVIRELDQKAISAINCCGQFTLLEMGEILREARSFIGRDSGPVHLAAAVGCPSFCVFPVTRPDVSSTRWRPLGPLVRVFEVDARPRPWQKNAAAAEKALARLDHELVVRSLRDFLTECESV